MLENHRREISNRLNFNRYASDSQLHQNPDSLDKSQGYNNFSRDATWGSRFGGSLGNLASTDSNWFRPRSGSDLIPGYYSSDADGGVNGLNSNSDHPSSSGRDLAYDFIDSPVQVAVSHTSNNSELSQDSGNAKSECEENEPEKNGETSIEEDFEKLRQFAAKISARPKAEAKTIEDSVEVVEVQEEPVQRSTVDREAEQDLHTRYSIFDRVQSSSVTLPDFSQFDNITFGTGEVDPDLLSMNLDIIPEETEEELEEEEKDKSIWRNNWSFKVSSSRTQ